MPSTRRLATIALWAGITLLALWLAVRVFGLEGGAFPLVQLMAFTPYVALASVVPVVWAAATRRWWPAAAALVVGLAFAAVLIPRGWADGGAAPGGPTLRVMSANLLLGRSDAPLLVDLVRRQRVDVLALQEFTGESRDRLSAAGLRDLLPYRAEYPQEGVGGSALYSRYPLTDLGFRRHRSGFGQAQATVTVPGAQPVQFESVHPCAPSGWDRQACWRRDLTAQPAAAPHGPLRVLAGDFNATLDHVVLRHLVDTGYRDAADVAGSGFTRTWPFDDRWYIPAMTLDHVLADRRIGVTGFAVLENPRSDHRVIFAELRLPPE